MKKFLDYLSIGSFLLAVLAFSRIDYLTANTFFGRFPNSKWFFLGAAILIGIYFIATVVFKVDRLTKAEAREILEEAPKIIELAEMGVVACDELEQSGDLWNIIRPHFEAIRSHIQKGETLALGKVPAVVDKTFVNAALDAKKNSQKQKEFESLAAARLGGLINAADLETFAQKEITTAQRKIITVIIENPKTKDARTYAESFAAEVEGVLTELQRDRHRSRLYHEYNPPVKDILTSEEFHWTMVAFPLITTAYRAMKLLGGGAEHYLEKVQANVTKLVIDIFAKTAQRLPEEGEKACYSLVTGLRKTFADIKTRTIPQFERARKYA